MWTAHLSFARKSLLYIAFGDRQNHCSSRHLLISGGSSAVKEPGHFEVRKSSSQVTQMHVFPQKKLTTFLVAARHQMHFFLKVSK